MVKDTGLRFVIDPGSSKVRVVSSTTKMAMHSLAGVDKQHGTRYYGYQLDGFLDEAKLHYERPIVRGVTTNFDLMVTLLQKAGRICGLQRRPQNKDGSLTCMLHPFQPKQVLGRFAQICFQYFGFETLLPLLSEISVYRQLSRASKANGVVVQCSDSATSVCLVRGGKLAPADVRRVEVGGRLMTAHLRQLISFRYYDLRQSELLVRQMKEEFSFVSLDFTRDMRRPAGYYAADFVLPDLDIGAKGYLLLPRQEQPPFKDIVRLDKERFQIPELIFTPADVGLRQQGLVETLWDMVKEQPAESQASFLQNVVVTGGCSRIPLFCERLARELRKTSPESIQPRVRVGNREFESALAGWEQQAAGVSREDFRQSGVRSLLPFVF